MQSLGLKFLLSHASYFGGISGKFFGRKNGKIFERIKWKNFDGENDLPSSCFGEQLVSDQIGRFKLPWNVSFNNI